MDEGLAAARAKTYEPVVSFTTEAVHVPHSPVDEEPEGAEGGEEEDSDAGTDVPGAAPSEVSGFSSGTEPVDAASTATEPSLFGDEPVDGGPAGPAAGDFFNTLASGDNDAGTIRPRAGVIPHLSYTGESSTASTTIGSRHERRSLEPGAIDIDRPDTAFSAFLMRRAGGGGGSVRASRARQHGATGPLEGNRLVPVMV
ncbi:hypothetical protein FRC08_017174 [Ceratobasidium sp. 394]|nr:hypothetical protein FRC08_017174 [Ceratobasidium sp. 394]KAG9095597.1 hypothetical protein FS749_010155 [Ceratobasidium sp. UAMH 11750]